MNRILLLAPSLAARTGGIATSCQSVLRLLGEKQEKGEVECRAFALLPTSDRTEEVQLNEWSHHHWKHFGASRMRFSWEAIHEASGWADLVLCMHPNLSQLQCFVPRFRRPKWIHFIHGTDVWYPLSLLKRHVLARNPSIAFSQFTVDKCRKFNPWFPEATVCHLGLPREVPKPTQQDCQQSLGFSPGRKDILIVGRLVASERQKGHTELYMAMAEVVKRVPEARLIVVGEGDDLERNQAVAQSTLAPSAIHFTGYLPPNTLSALYDSVGVFCLPGRQEGFGLVYLEAMRAGLPCVATQADAAKEIIQDEVTGRVVTDRDPDALAKALVDLLTDEPKRQRLGEAGRLRFQKEFQESHFHERLWRHLKKFLPSQP